MPPIHLGVSISAGNATWPEISEAALAAESFGFDSLWSPDHFLTSAAAPTGDYLEAWQILGALAALTSRAKIGTLVTPVEFRNPGVLAKMAATVDHVSNGRVILGLGAGWYEQEYAQFGLSYGPPAERVKRLAETVQICRSLFDRPRTTFEGTYYRLHAARAEPKPLQPRLPILVGGDGDTTIRIAGRYADWWNGFGAADEIARKIALLRGAAEKAGRRADEVTPSVTFRPAIVRDRAEEIDEQLRVTSERHHLAKPDAQYLLAGDARAVADRLVAYIRLGVRAFVVQTRAPFDLVSLERLAREVRPLVEAG